MQFVYFASPMCSWCWGFSPVVQQIKKAYPANQIRLVLTPFRIDTTQAMDDSLRNYVLGQWHKVQQTTAQPFDFNFSMPPGFIYNTRLVGLAIKAFKKQLVKQELEFMHALQQCFYTKNRDLTNQDVLIEVAKNFPINLNLFTADLISVNIAEQLEQDFNLCQQLAVQSYPTLMAEKNGVYAMLSNGYATYEQLNLSIEAQLSN